MKFSNFYKAPWHIRAWIWLKANWYYPVAFIVGIGALAIVLSTGGRSGRELLRADAIMRKRRVKAEQELKELEDRTEKEIQEVEAVHAEKIVDFKGKQAAEYERVRRRGPEATAEWLNDFNRRMMK